MAARRAVGAPPAVVIVPLGGDYLDQDLDMVARGGAVGVLGAHVGANSTFRTDLLFLKGVTLYDTPRAPLTEMAEMASLVAFGFVTPIVDRAFALTDIEAAAPWARWRLRCGRVSVGGVVGAGGGRARCTVSVACGSVPSKLHARRVIGSTPTPRTRCTWRGCCGDLMRARYRLSKLLLRQGIVYSDAA